MATTVSQFIAKAVALIDDTPNVSSYGAAYLPFVSIVVTELMTEGIGVKTAYSIPAITSTTQTMPISDEAINAVAVFRLASMLAAVSNNTGWTNHYDDEYQKAKQSWKRHQKATFTEIEDVYNFNMG